MQQPVSIGHIRRFARPSTLWQNRVYRLYWLSLLVAFTGQWMQNVAYGWVVYEMTDSRFLLGLLGFVGSLPTTLFSLFGGVIADHTERRRLVMITQVIFALTTLILAVLVLTGHASFWHFALIAAINGTVVALDAPARQAMVTDIVGPRDLAAAVAMNSAAFNTARVMGPVLAGKLIEWVGAGWCFVANGVSYLAVVGVLSVAPGNRPGPRRSGVTVFREIGEGLRAVMSDPILRMLLVVDATVSVFALSYGTLMPVFAKDHFGVNQSGLGVMLSSTGVGALIGAFSLSAMNGRTPRGWALILTTGGLCVCLAGLALTRSYGLALVALAGVGCCTVATLASINAMLQVLSPAAMRGRAVSMHVFALMGLAPFGSLFMGALAARYDASAAVLCGVAITALVWAAMLSRREIRRLGPV